jgi:phosphopantetheine adenylyltransferase
LSTHLKIPLKHPHFNPSVCSTWDKGYRYGFNTQEKDDEIAGVGNIYTAEYWEYDSRLGRRWNLDPVDQVWMSNYSVLGNCPIFMVDINGDEFSPKDKKEIKKYEKSLKNNLNYVDKEISKLNKNLSTKLNDLINPDLNENERENISNEISKLSNEINQLRTIRDDLKQAQIELQDLKTRKEIIRLSRDEQPRTRKTGDEFTVSYHDWGSLGHELKHVFQFYQGKINFEDDGRAGNLYDKNDEVEAFRREYSIRYSIKLRTGAENYFETLSEYLLISNINQIDLNYIRNVNGGAYRRLSEDDLRGQPIKRVPIKSVLFFIN